MPRLSHSSVARLTKENLSVTTARGAPPRTDSTILLVDDDSAVREGLCRVLAIEGWNIVTAASGEDALERLRENEPALMITDLRMTPISGWDLLFHENMQRPRMPIFVITALSFRATNGAAKFAAEFFQKPLDLDVLVAAVRCYLADGSL